MDHRLAEVLWRGDAAEAQVDGWFAGIKECLQFCGQWTLIGQYPGARLNDTLVCQMGQGASVGSAASHGRSVSR